MVNSDEEFFKQLLETFKMEAEEHITELTNGLLELEKNPKQGGSAENLETIYREAHNLKGAARAVDLEVIQNICQAFENLLSELKNGTIQLSKELFQIGFESLDYINLLLESPHGDVESPEVYTAIIDKLNALCTTEDLVEVAAAATAPPPPIEQKKPKQENLEEANIEKLLRVSSHKLDGLITQIEELLSIKIMYSQLREHLYLALDNLKSKVKLEKQLATFRQLLLHHIPSSAPYYQSMLALFDESTYSINEMLLLTSSTLEKVYKESAQDKYVIENIISSLLEDSKKLLMQPFSTLVAAFPRMVRDISGQLQKEIVFSIEGEDVEIDRRILEELKDPLIHMIRNSIDHGIEMPDERVNKQKSREGHVNVSISQVGSNHINLIVSDDGKGFSIDKLREKGIQEGAISESQATSLSDDEIVKLAFRSGLSTADIITELSGRGLGLGIMAEKIEKLGGSYTIHTQEGEGTQFHLSLPLTRATFRGLQISSGEKEFIIPTQNISRILRSNAYNLSTVENQQVIFLENKNYPVEQLYNLLNMQVKQEQAPNLVLIVSSGHNELAIGVDRIINEQEVFVKGLGKQLAHVPNIAAATILEGGRIIPILDIVDLIQSAIHLPTRGTFSQIDAKSIQKHTVLVVEDTPTTRLLFKNILQQAGYNVLTASNGVEGFETLITTHVDLIITDIEMPRMTGFELIEKIHKEDKLSDIPIIIITALESQADKKRGIDLGANAYIEKSNFVQNELITITKKLL